MPCGRESESEIVEFRGVARVKVSGTFLRGQRVILDSDLATLYGVKTKALNQAVTRNIERFPSDFMFRLTEEEGRF